MSGLLGIKGQTSSPKIGGLRMQTSLYSLPIPIVYGQARITGNLVQMPKAPGVISGSKLARRTKGSQATTRYFAPVVVALCEGQIAGIGQVWADTSTGDDYTAVYAPAGWNLFNGGSGNAAPWTYLSSQFPAQALFYPGVTYVAHQSLELPGGSMQNYAWEIKGLLQVGGLIVDAHPKDVIVDFLTNVDHGLAWPTSKIGDLTAYHDYVTAAGLFLSPAVDQQQAASAYLQEWLQATNSAAVWSDGKIKIVPYADTPITGNSVTYTPNVTPLYDLTDDNFLADAGTDPVRCTRKKPAEAYNQLFVEFEDRTLGYAPNVAEAKIESDILAYGLRPAPKIQLRSVKSFSTARLIAQLVLQRMNAIRDTYQFELGFQFSMLEPMDIVTLTDAGLGLSRTPVRITAIEELEDDKGFQITAEELLIGSADASRYQVSGVFGLQQNLDVDPGNTTAPAIFEGPTSPVEIWIAASGGANWGGCDVYISTDDATYYPVGRIIGKAAYGVLTAALASGAALPAIDTVNTLAVDLTPSGGALASGGANDVSNLLTLSYVDGEFLSFLTASLISAFHYNLTTLGRGAFSSPMPASHPIGATFVRCDPSQGLFKYPFPQGTTGQTLYVKLPAFNIFGRAVQDVATATRYTHVIDARVRDELRSILRITPSESTDGTQALLALIVSPAVDHVQAYYRTVPRDTDPKQAADFSNTAVLPVDGINVVRAVGGACSFTGLNAFPQPPREKTLYTRLVPWYLSPAGTMVPGESIVFPVNPAPPQIKVQITATKSGNRASLSVAVAAGVSDLPGTLSIVETVLGVSTTILANVPITGTSVTLSPGAFPALANRVIPAGAESVTWTALFTDVAGQTLPPFGPVTALPALVLASVNVSENTAARTATITATLTDSGGYLNPAAADALNPSVTGAVTVHTTLRGVKTVLPCTSIPVSGTTGDYVFTLNLDPTRPILVEMFRHYVDGSTDELFSNQLDSNKLSDVVNAAAVNNGATANVPVQFDNDTKIGAGFARYSLNGGSTWTTGTVASDYSALFTGIARTASVQSMIIQGQNAIDGQWGNQTTVQIDAYLSEGPIFSVQLLANTPDGAHDRIVWSCTQGTVLVSIDGGSFGTPSASPFDVAKPATGRHTYVFQFTNGGVTVTDEVDVLPVSADTITPNLDVALGTPTASTMPYTATAANPVSGGATPTITVKCVGCTMTIAGTTYPDGTTQTIASGTVVTGNKAASTTTTNANLEFVAALGAATERIVVPVPPQLAIGPSLQINVTLTGTTFSIAWSGTGVITYAIDGNTTYVTPPASPITGSRNTSDHTYSFKADADGQTFAPPPVVVPALGFAGVGSDLKGTFNTTSNTLLATGNPGQVRFSWTQTGFDASVAYNIYVRDQAFSGDQNYHAVATTAPNATHYDYSTPQNLSGGIATPVTIGFFAEATLSNTNGPRSAPNDQTYGTT